MDLVVHQVEQLQDVGDAHRHLLLERLTRAPVEELGLAHLVHHLVAVAVGMHRADRLQDLALARAVEHRGGHVGRARVIHAVLLEAPDRREAQVRLEDLPQVHPGRDAQRVEDDVDRGAVLQERHVLFGQDRAMTPLLPWRPASLSPSEIFRFWAT